MTELTTIGDYEVREIDRVGPIVRYAATHIVLPRRAIIEIVDADAPRVDAMKLMRRACILEALHHPAVPRVFECGRLDGRPWIATSHDGGITLEEELQHRRLEVREALTLLDEVAGFLAHAHARGVLHGNITAMAIVRAPALSLLRWEKACVHDSELGDAIDGREDVFALGMMIAAAVVPGELPAPLHQLLARMLADHASRPTAADVVATVRTIAVDEIELDRMLEALADDSVEIEIERDGVDDGDFILLDHRLIRSVIVDLDASS